MFAKIREFILNFRRYRYINRFYFSSQQFDGEASELERVYGLTEVESAYLMCMKENIPFFNLRTDLYDQVRRYAKAHFQWTFPQMLTAQDIIDQR